MRASGRISHMVNMCLFRGKQNYVVAYLIELNLNRHRWPIFPFMHIYLEVQEKNGWHIRMKKCRLRTTVDGLLEYLRVKLL